LQNYLIAKGYNWDGTTANNKIAKALAAKTDWHADSTIGATGCDLTTNNRSGFSALPGGYRNDEGLFFGIGKCGYWWSAPETWYRRLCSNLEDLDWNSYYDSHGFSVRLVRD
jgi:uncharacterized protein (TIGR02145 family)